MVDFWISLFVLLEEFFVVIGHKPHFSKVIVGWRSTRWNCSFLYSHPAITRGRIFHCLEALSVWSQKTVNEWWQSAARLLCVCVNSFCSLVFGAPPSASILQHLMSGPGSE